MSNPPKASEVIVAFTVDLTDPDEAIAFVRAELAAKLAAQDWHEGGHHLLPKFDVRSVRAVERLDERGDVAG